MDQAFGNLPIFERLVFREEIYAEMFFKQGGLGGQARVHWSKTECEHQLNLFKQQKLPVIEIEKAIKAIDWHRDFIKNYKPHPDKIPAHLRIWHWLRNIGGRNV